MASFHSTVMCFIVLNVPSLLGFTIVRDVSQQLAKNAEYVATVDERNDTVETSVYRYELVAVFNVPKTPNNNLTSSNDPKVIAPELKMIIESSAKTVKCKQSSEDNDNARDNDAKTGKNDLTNEFKNLQAIADDTHSSRIFTGDDQADKILPQATDSDSDQADSSSLIYEPRTIALEPQSTTENLSNVDNVNEQDVDDKNDDPLIKRIGDALSSPSGSSHTTPSTVESSTGNTNTKNEGSVLETHNSRQSQASRKETMESNVFQEPSIVEANTETSTKTLENMINRLEQAQNESTNETDHSRTTGNGSDETRRSTEVDKKNGTTSAQIHESTTPIPITNEESKNTFIMIKSTELPPKSNINWNDEKSNMYPNYGTSENDSKSSSAATTNKPISKTVASSDRGNPYKQFNNGFHVNETLRVEVEICEINWTIYLSIFSRNWSKVFKIEMEKGWKMVRFTQNYHDTRKWVHLGEAKLDKIYKEGDVIQIDVTHREKGGKKFFEVRIDQNEIGAFPIAEMNVGDDLNRASFHVFGKVILRNDIEF